MTAKAAKAPTKKTKTVKAKATASNSKAKTTAKVVEAKAGGNNLVAWNLRLGIVLLLLAVAVVVVGESTTTPLTSQYLAKDALASAAAGHDVFAAATKHLWDVPVSWLVAKFLVAFGALFLLTATVWRKHYENWLAKGVNKIRWIGFGLGTGLMAVTVAMLSGITDLGYLLLVLASLLVLGSLATTVELIGPGRRLRKYEVITALGVAALPVVVLGLNLKGVLLYNGDMPAYLYYVYGSMFLVAAAFALACIFRLRRRGKWADVVYTEKMMMGLGFTAAVVLALQIFAGVLQP